MVKEKANRYNELTGKEWLQYSFSIWRDIRKNNGEKQLKHPAIFPVQLAARIINIFTKANDVVLDPFAGIGSTIIAAYKEGRKGIGFELSAEFANVTQKRIQEVKDSNLDRNNIKPEIYNADSRNLLDYIKVNSTNLCVTSPPYWDILNMRRTADIKVATNYGNSKADLGNIKKYDSFLNELQVIFTKVYMALKNNGHCIVILMDIRKKDKFYPFHSDLAKKMEEIGFTFEDIIIWDRQHEYNNMRPLGYPYIFRVNKVHEYILIFKKRAKKNG